MKNVQETTAQPARWVIVVSVIDPAGEGHIRHSYECRDLLHAQTLLTELRDLAEEFGKFLPGLSVDGYEMVDGILHLPSFVEVMEASDMDEEDKIYWRAEIAREGLLGAA